MRNLKAVTSAKPGWEGTSEPGEAKKHARGDLAPLREPSWGRTRGAHPQPTALLGAVWARGRALPAPAETGRGVSQPSGHSWDPGHPVLNSSEQQPQAGLASTGCPSLQNSLQVPRTVQVMKPPPTRLLGLGPCFVVRGSNLVTGALAETPVAVSAARSADERHLSR